MLIFVISPSYYSNGRVRIRLSSPPLQAGISRWIKNNINLATKYDAVDTVIPSADTIIRSIDNETIYDIPARNELYIGQTPQSFKFGLIKEAYEFARRNRILEGITDDCRVVLNYGKKVYLVEGDPLNLKITRSEDLFLFE